MRRAFQRQRHHPAGAPVQPMGRPSVLGQVEELGAGRSRDIHEARDAEWADHCDRYPKPAGRQRRGEIAQAPLGAADVEAAGDEQQVGPSRPRRRTRAERQHPGPGMRRAMTRPPVQQWRRGTWPRRSGLDRIRPGGVRSRTVEQHVGGADRFGLSSHVGSDHRNAGGDRLHRGDRDAFEQAGVQEHVERREQAGGAGDRTGHDERSTDTQGASLRIRGVAAHGSRTVGRGTQDDEPCVTAAAAELGEDADRPGVALLRREAADHADKERVRVGAEGRPELQLARRR